MQTSFTNMARAFAGMVEGFGYDKNARTYWNDLGSLAQVADVSFSAVNSQAYTFTVNGITVTYTSDATATLAEIRDGLITAFRVLNSLEEVAFANASGNNVRVTAKTPGVAITVTNVANTTVTAVQANVAQADIPFGRAVCRRVGTGTNERSAHLPGGAVAQVSTVTFTAVNSTFYALEFHMTDGQVYRAELTSDASATTQEIRDGIQAAMISMAIPITPVDLSTDGLTLTSTVPGVGFTILEDPTGSIAQAAVTANTTNIFLGISERVHSVVNPTNPGEGVGPSKPFAVVTRGAIYVETEETIVSETDEVWFRHTASGVNTALGRFRNDADSGTCTRVTKASWRKGVTGPGLALLEVNLP